MSFVQNYTFSKEYKKIFPESSKKCFSVSQKLKKNTTYKHFLRLQNYGASFFSVQKLHNTTQEFYKSLTLLHRASPYFVPIKVPVGIKEVNKDHLGTCFNLVMEKIAS